MSCECSRDSLISSRRVSLFKLRLALVVALVLVKQLLCEDSEADSDKEREEPFGTEGRCMV